MDYWEFDGDASVYDSARNLVRNFVSYMKGGSNFKQSFAAILLSIMTDVLAGLFLGNLEETLLLLPGLIVLIPGAMSMRGNIFGALGSRIGSALHMKRIDEFSFSSKYIRKNTYSSITLTVFTSVALAFIAWSFLLLFGIKTVGVLDLLLVSFIGGVVSGIILLFITFGVTFTAHRRKWDPDNVTSPMITATGDFFTIPALALAANFVLGIGAMYVMLLSGFVIAVAIVSIFLVFKTESAYDALVFREDSYRNIVAQSVFIMLFAGALSAFSGVFLELNLSALVTVPIILTLVPAFLEEGGNIGNIMSSRLSTKLHAGTMNSDLKIDNEIKREIVNSYILSLIVFQIVSVLVYILGSALNMVSMPLGKLMFVAGIAGIILTTIIIFVSFFVSVISFRYKINPDNVTIPLITGTADLIGVVTLILVVKSFGII